MNNLALCIALADKASINTTSLTDVTTTAGELDRVVTWIKDAWLDLQTQQQGEWNFLFSEFNRNTRARKLFDIAPAVDNGSGLVGIPIVAHGYASGDLVKLTGTVAYEGEFSVHATTTANELVITTTYIAESFVGTEQANVRDFEFYTANGVQNFNKDTFGYFLATDGQGARSPLQYVEWQEFRAKYYDYTESNNPQKITVMPNRRLRVWPDTDAVYTIQADSFLIPQELAVNADIPLMPTNLHMLIVWKALIDYAGYEEASAVFAHAAMRHDELYEQYVWTEQYKKEDIVIRPV
jgi:hypothetical protein